MQALLMDTLISARWSHVSIRADLHAGHTVEMLLRHSNGDRKGMQNGCEPVQTLPCTQVRDEWVEGEKHCRRHARVIQWHMGHALHTVLSHCKVHVVPQE